jgi:hypothetical protein
MCKNGKIKEKRRGREREGGREGQGKALKG